MNETVVAHVLISPREAAYSLAHRFNERGFRWSLNYSVIASRPQVSVEDFDCSSGNYWDQAGLAFWVIAYRVD